ncbi:MAG TPA: hypothetical protein VNL39_15180 [Xanthobacteraceae bacterium]|nr:hypothetical protein [Xanthobacteraceae bacterium]
MLLILHWAAPSFRPFDLPPATDRSIPPHYAPAEIGPYNGALPRLLARGEGVEVALPKFKRNHASAAGSKAILAGTLRHDPAGDRAAPLTAVLSAPPAAPPKQPFQARAPPAATA